ncbi:DUF3606 domain-containing protein [Duganella sp. S19_KUP01_CR8]|uniref:DUF3606 domain-containing protein n=1 Tax=Duganella sp. S19_KUP01_CR8 TaxID=3025502 RepID=UPI002FCD9A1F
MKTIIARKPYGKPVTGEVRDDAIARGRVRSFAGPHATALRYLKSRRAIELDFADRTAITLPIEKYGELASLSEEALSQLELGFGGSVLCLDERDLHISIAGLVAASQPLKEVAAAVTAVRVGDRISGRIGKGVVIYRKPGLFFNQINPEEKLEIQYWVQTLGVSEEQLTRAIKDSKERQEAKQKASGIKVVAKKRFRPA